MLNTTTVLEALAPWVGGVLIDEKAQDGFKPAVANMLTLIGQQRDPKTPRRFRYKIQGQYLSGLGSGVYFPDTNMTVFSNGKQRAGKPKLVNCEPEWLD